MEKNETRPSAAVSQAAEALEAIPFGRNGIELTTAGAVWRFAQFLYRAGLAPRGLDTPQALLVALQYGRELGLTLMQSLQNICVVNGRPCVWGDTLLALCMAHPEWDPAVFHEWSEGDGEAYTAYCRVGRIGRQEQVVRHFSVQDAKDAGLWGKSGPWSTMPRRMLQMRARAFALRDTFPDALHGAHATEELIGSEPQATELRGLDKLRATLQQQPGTQGQAPDAATAAMSEAVAPEPTEAGGPRARRQQDLLGE